MNDLDEKALRRYGNQKCPDCKSNILIKVVQKQIIGVCQNI